MKREVDQNKEKKIRIFDKTKGQINMLLKITKKEFFNKRCWIIMISLVCISMRGALWVLESCQKYFHGQKFAAVQVSPVFNDLDLKRFTCMYNYLKKYSF